MHSLLADNLILDNFTLSNLLLEFSKYRITGQEPGNRAVVSLIDSKILGSL